MSDDYVVGSVIPVDKKKENKDIMDYCMLSQSTVYEFASEVDEVKQQKYCCSFGNAENA